MPKRIPKNKMQIYEITIIVDYTFSYLSTDKNTLIYFFFHFKLTTSIIIR